MRCVWVKAEERSRTLPLLPGVVARATSTQLRPPVDNRLQGTSSWINLATKRDRARPAGWSPPRRRTTPVSRLRELVEAGDGLILTGEAPTDRRRWPRRVSARASPRWPTWVDAINATDNTGRPRARLERRGRDRAARSSGSSRCSRSCAATRTGSRCQADIVGAALHGVENVCCLTGDDVTAGDEPEARRVFDLDGPQLVRVATGLARGRYLSGRTHRAAAARSSSARSRTPPPRRSSTGAERAAKKIARRRALPPAPDLLPPRPPRGVRRAACTRRGLTARAALLPTIVLVRGARALSFMDRQRARASTSRRDDRPRVEQADDPGEAAYAARAGAGAARALAARASAASTSPTSVTTVSLSRLCRELGIPTKEERRAHAHRAPLPV